MGPIILFIFCFAFAVALIATINWYTNTKEGREYFRETILKDLMRPPSRNLEDLLSIINRKKRKKDD